jgi:hypothetical protein
VVFCRLLKKRERKRNQSPFRIFMTSKPFKSKKYN